jgi:glutamyl-tRNA reductase
MYAAKEYYIRGTERKAEIKKYEEELKKKQQQEELKKKIEEITKKGGKAVTVKICTHSGYAATPSCTSVKEEVFDSKDPRANYFCPQHNPDKKKYPVKK